MNTTPQTRDMTPELQSHVVRSKQEYMAECSVRTMRTATALFNRNSCHKLSTTQTQLLSFVRNTIQHRLSNISVIGSNHEPNMGQVVVRDNFSEIEIYK